jgi:asparagine synthase (glutamine-hydrolysing)
MQCAALHPTRSSTTPAVRDELLADSPVFDLIRRDRIAELVSKRDLPNSRSKFLFNFVNTKMFLEEYAA